MGLRWGGAGGGWGGGGGAAHAGNEALEMKAHSGNLPAKVPQLQTQEPGVHILDPSRKDLRPPR